MTRREKRSVFDQAARDIGRAKKIFVLTGEGLSQESGLPPFIDDAKLWHGHKPSWLVRRQTFEREPELVWDWYRQRRREVRRHEPNAAHRALADWQAEQSNMVVITSCTAGLHREAGHEVVYEYQGSIWEKRCEACNRVTADRVQLQIALPRCPDCQAVERPDVSWLDHDGVNREYNEDTPFMDFQLNAGYDMALVIGTGIVEQCFGFTRWLRTVEVHDQGQRGGRSTFVPGPARSILPQLLKAAATHRR